MKKRLKINPPSPSAIEAIWQREATRAALAAVRDLTKPGGAIPPGAPLGRLSDTELGWVVAAVLFSWISKRAEQATAEMIDTELAIRMTGLDPDPWDCGAIETILPDLAEAAYAVDWSKPLGSWSREEMIHFLVTALGLIRKALIARDLAGGGIARKGGAHVAREANAACGGPLMTPSELDDEIGL